MTKYKLSNEAKSDLIRIHQYDVRKFGMVQTDKYFNSLFEYFNIIADRPFSFESVNYIKKIIDNVFAELVVFTLRLMEIL